MNEKTNRIWSIPYVDLPVDFWEDLCRKFGNNITEVYFPIQHVPVGSGRPVQPSRFLDEFLEARLFPLSVLVNPVILQKPVESLAPEIIDEIKRLQQEYRINSATVANIMLAEEIRKSIPGLKIIASVLADISSPYQAEMIAGIFDVIVPSSRIMRNIPALKSLKEAFHGNIRLIVNEGCLPGCPFRIQHFYEMANACGNPKSLCAALLEKQPWLRLTGSWVLPQHLHLYGGIYDELKLSGRVALGRPDVYENVLASYIFEKELTPDKIGGGPAVFHHPFFINESFYKQTLYCSRLCHKCTVCKNYYEGISFKT